MFEFAVLKYNMNAWQGQLVGYPGKIELAVYSNRTFLDVIGLVSNDGREIRNMEPDNGNWKYVWLQREVNQQGEIDA
jgi:hypothetical protein